MNVLDKTKQAIIDAGFSHIKLELEAELNRDDGERYVDCDDCDDGRITCDSCDGEGARLESEQIGVRMREHWVECYSCDGEGDHVCDYCDGSGQVYGGAEWDDDTCDSFIRDHVSTEAAMALTYGKFYNDGSVDSEYTFTLPVAQAQYLPEFIKAFKALADEIGNGMDTDGAGMHVAIIPTEMNGRYPSTHRLDSVSVANFTTQMNKLLPALFFTASPNGFSRGLGYRNPRVAPHDKYSAIYTQGGTCFEYRVFETCYNNPEAIFEYMEVIANSLKFLNPENTVESLRMQFSFPDDNRDLARFFDTPEQMRVLTRTIKHLKPSTKSFKKMKAERGIKHNIGTLQVAAKRRVNQLKLDYAEVERRNKALKEIPLTGQEQAEVTYLEMSHQMTRDQAIEHVRRITDQTFEQFVHRNVYRDRYATTITV